jgi:hypothetical protein
VGRSSKARCHPLPLKHLAPLAEGQVAREQQAAPLVAVGEHLEQQLRPCAAERQVAQLVAGQQVGPIELAQEPIRNDLALMYLVKIDPREGRLVDVRLVPVQVRRVQLKRTSEADGKWLCDLLNRLGAAFRTRVQLKGDNSLTLRWQRREESRQAQDGQKPGFDPTLGPPQKGANGVAADFDPLRPAALARNPPESRSCRPSGP